MATMTQEEIDRFLDLPLIAHVTSIRADGSPHTVPIWYMHEDGVFYVFTPSPSVKMRNLRRDPRMTISIASQDEPYRYVVAGGEVEFITDVDVIFARGGKIGARYRGPAGVDYIKDVHASYEGGATLLVLKPTRLRAWASGT